MAQTKVAWIPQDVEDMLAEQHGRWAATEEPEDAKAKVVSCQDPIQKCAPQEWAIRQAQ